jgi:hypothetical protein
MLPKALDILNTEGSAIGTSWENIFSIKRSKVIPVTGRGGL